MPESEVVGLLRALLRFDTTNPPGNELACARHLDRFFKREGVPSRVLISKEGRGNVIARLKGGPKPPLLLSAHLDVVPAAGKWTHPPFAAIVKNGYVWGRGAVDMKHMAAMSALVLAGLKRRRVRLDRDVIFAGVADEEVSGAFGAGWLVEKHPELVRAGVCLTEVGGVATPVNGRMLVPVQVAQKGVAWLRLRASGEGGHGSAPLPGSAVERLAEAVVKLAKRPLGYRLTPTTRRFIEALASLEDRRTAGTLLKLLSEKGAAGALASLPPSRRRVLSAMLHDTAAPTCLHAGVKINVIPTEAEALVDGRVLPGRSPKAFLAEVRRAVGPDIRVELVDSAPALETSWRGPMWDSITRVMSRRLPGCVVAPQMLTGMTDAKDWARLGIKTYGFAPLLLAPGEDFAELYHAPDERVSVKGLEAGFSWLTDVVDDFCGLT